MEHTQSWEKTLKEEAVVLTAADAQEIADEESDSAPFIYLDDLLPLVATLLTENEQKVRAEERTKVVEEVREKINKEIATYNTYNAKDIGERWAISALKDLLIALSPHHQ